MRTALACGGPQDRGSLAKAGLFDAQASRRVLYMATLGKAAGAAGAFVARLLRQHHQHARLPGPARHAGARARRRRQGLLRRHCRHGRNAPLASQKDLAELDPFEFVRTIAVARITMPTARVRLSAGRQQMGDGVQTLCFLAGANSIFYGDKLLTTGNPDTDADVNLLARLGMTRSAPQAA